MMTWVLGFWSAYFLERVIAMSLGRPYSLADHDIDVTLPLEIVDMHYNKAIHLLP